jgi:hypothetical protein
MQTRRVKEELKKQDALQSAFQIWKIWVSQNTKVFIIGCCLVVAIGLGVWGFAAYRANKDNTAQHQLALAIRSFEEYLITSKAEALPTAETAFKQVAKDGTQGIRDVARLYLAQIATIKGQKSEAKNIYGQLSTGRTNDVVRKLAETALQDIDKPRK